jgi:biotin-(acetyl-CoA carboxylase) ligase
LPYLPAAGSPIVVQTAERRLEGIVEQILENGALLVRDQSGGRFPVVAGEIPFGPGESA